MDDFDSLMATRPPTASRPLLGLTVLVVEDSHFACEALRLLCLRSGARIRRADSLRAARRHLRVYRPSVLIVDMGLPDGHGAELIEEMARATPRVEVILATSGATDSETAALAAGADGFLAKPLESLAAFQEAVLSHLPPERQPVGPRAMPQDIVAPDPLALQDDMALVADILSNDPDQDMVSYVVQFLTGVARSARDVELETLANMVHGDQLQGRPMGTDLARLAAVVHTRMSERMAI